MNASKYILPAAFLAIATFSMCDYVTDPKDVADIVITFDTTKRVAIIEEWTGHTCIACPAAARDIEQLDSVYGESFIAISIHDDYFAEPCPTPHPTPPCGQSTPGAFSEDFRCPTGASYSAAHVTGPQSPPQGMVNRLGMASNTEVKNRGVWPGMVDSIIQTDAIASIHIDHNYNSATRAVTATVRGTWLMAYTGNLNVAVMLTESGMVGWQTDGPTDCDSEFVFQHVLRECINTPGSITGTSLFNGTTGIGTTYSYTAPTYTLPANFDAAGCHLVAIIYDTVTGEVMQAWEEHVQ